VRYVETAGDPSWAFIVVTALGVGVHRMVFLPKIRIRLCTTFDRVVDRASATCDAPNSDMVIHCTETRGRDQCINALGMTDP